MISAGIPERRRISRQFRRCSTSMRRPECCRRWMSRSSSTRPSSRRCSRRAVVPANVGTLLPSPLVGEGGCDAKHRRRVRGSGPSRERDPSSAFASRRHLLPQGEKESAGTTEMKKWRSRVTIDGLDRAPHRAFMRAMGLDDAALAKPMIGVVSMKGEQTPCNMTHDFQVDAAKVGIAEAGGTPREFTTVSVSDGISMNHEGMKFSLFSRELIADSIEAVVHGLAYDALIGFGGCDKTLPGVMMGMIRCNLPSICMYGGG